MLDFYNNEYDVLVCTTIIEAGLDIPNVNTIIISDADKWDYRSFTSSEEELGVPTGSPMHI